MTPKNLNELKNDVPNAEQTIVNELCEAIHRSSFVMNKMAKEKGFYDNEINVGEKLMLIVSEIAEGMEGHRKGQKDDHLPQHSSLAVELADAVIRILDLSAALDLNLSEAIRDKYNYNRTRPYKHGKKY